LNPSVKGSFLKVPKHVIEPFLYYIQAPFVNKDEVNGQEGGKK
jgi:hypothetical protein